MRRPAVSVALLLAVVFVLALFAGSATALAKEKNDENVEQQLSPPRKNEGRKAVKAPLTFPTVAKGGVQEPGKVYKGEDAGKARMIVTDRESFERLFEFYSNVVKDRDDTAINAPVTSVGQDWYQLEKMLLSEHAAASSSAGEDGTTCHWVVAADRDPARPRVVKLGKDEAGEKYSNGRSGPGVQSKLTYKAHGTACTQRQETALPPRQLRDSLMAQIVCVKSGGAQGKGVLTPPHESCHVDLSYEGHAHASVAVSTEGKFCYGIGGRESAAGAGVLLFTLAGKKAEGKGVAVLGGKGSAFRKMKKEMMSPFTGNGKLENGVFGGESGGQPTPASAEKMEKGRGKRSDEGAVDFSGSVSEGLGFSVAVGADIRIGVIADGKDRASAEVQVDELYLRLKGGASKECGVKNIGMWTRAKKRAAKK